MRYLLEITIDVAVDDFDGRNQLVRNVNELIAEQPGWEPLGGVSVTTYRDEANVEIMQYTQAMINRSLPPFDEGDAGPRE